MKYIIDIPDEAIEFMGGRSHINVFVEPECKVGDCKHYALRISKEDITPYTVPDRKAIENEVWEFASMLMNMHSDVAENIYWSMNGGKGIGVAAEMTYQQAKDRYEEWKRKKDEIHIGDELVNHLGRAYVIYHIDRDKQLAYGIDVTRGYPLPQETFPMHERYTPNKTGRHFDGVERLLEEMRS